MRPETTEQKLIDYILLNACSVNSSGLYHGKAGMALALFEAARQLHDDYVEEQAFGLLEEALLSKNEDIGFENGLAGIGYTLLYLIENEFIEADFDELFSEQYQKIATHLAEKRTGTNSLPDQLKIVYFLTEVEKIKPQQPEIRQMIQTLFEAAELYLAIQFFDFNDLHYIGDKTTVLKTFETYLTLADYAGYKQVSHEVLADYARLYRSGRMAGSYAISFYLEKMTAEQLVRIDKECWTDTPKKIVQPACIETLSLRERIDLSKFPDVSQTVRPHLLPAAEKARRKERLGQFLLRAIPDPAFYAGYGQGLSRFLIYCVNQQARFV